MQPKALRKVEAKGNTFAARELSPDKRFSPQRWVRGAGGRGQINISVTWQTDRNRLMHISCVCTSTIRCNMTVTGDSDSCTLDPRAAQYCRTLVLYPFTSSAHYKQRHSQDQSQETQQAAAAAAAEAEAAATTTKAWQLELEFDEFSSKRMQKQSTSVSNQEDRRNEHLDYHKLLRFMAQR